RQALAPDRPVAQLVHARLFLPADGTGQGPARSSPRVLAGRPRPGSGVHPMPDLLDPADPRGGSREVIADGRLQIAEVRPASLQSASGNRQSAPPLLLFEQVSKWYGPVLGINQVTLELRPGITGLVGANGAGKSTLLRLATGHLRPDLGSVRVGGRDAWSHEAKRQVAYCPGLDTFYEELSGRALVGTVARLRGCWAS